MKEIATGLLSALALSEAGFAEQPFKMDGSIVSEVWSNVQGGRETGMEYLAYANAGIEIDGNALLGLEGSQARIAAIYSNGVALNELVGASQPISNIETDVHSAWLYEAWLQVQLGIHASLRFGLQEINEEFDASESRSLFLHSSQGVGGAFGSSGVTGPSTYPYTGLAARFSYVWQDSYYLNIGVFDGVPGSLQSPKKTVVKLKNSEGALYIAEAGFAHENTKLSVGYWAYSAAYEDILTTPAEGEVIRGKGNRGLYGLLELPLLPGRNGSTSVSGFVRAGIANKNFNAIRSYLSAGAVLEGFLPNRDADQLGLSVIRSSHSRDYQQILGYGVSGKHETVFELTYKMQLADWAYLQPDLQYIVNPSMDPDLKNATVLGLRLGLEW